MKKMKVCLWLGLLGALLGTAGELLGGVAPASDFSSRTAITMSSLMGVPLWRLGLCSTLGCLGILLQYFGYYGLLLSFEDRENRRGWVYYGANWGFTVVGAVYHVLCCAMILVMQILSGDPRSRELLTGALVWFLLPVAAVFFAGYLLVCGILFLQIAGGHSSFPRWCCLINPLVLLLLLQGVLCFLPGSALVNGLSFAGIGISSCLVFAVLLLAAGRRPR